MTYEFILTLLVVLVVFAIKRDALTLTLLCAWVFSFSSGVFMPVGLLPMGASLIDVCIATSAYYLWSEHESQRARIVGFLSLVKLFAHFGISAGFGTGDWFLYAIMVNAGFVLQCLVAGGLILGLVDFLNSISPRHSSRGTIASQKKRS